MKEYISPLYIMKLIDSIYENIWKTFDTSKYKKVENYLRMWQEDSNPPFHYMDFDIYYKDDKVDVLKYFI